jgi:hypothetical protein
MPEDLDSLHNISGLEIFVRLVRAQQTELHDKFSVNPDTTQVGGGVATLPTLMKTYAALPLLMCLAAFMFSSNLLACYRSHMGYGASPMWNKFP